MPVLVVPVPSHWLPFTFEIHININMLCNNLTKWVLALK